MNYFKNILGSRQQVKEEQDIQVRSDPVQLSGQFELIQFQQDTQFEEQKQKMHRVPNYQDTVDIGATKIQQLNCNVQNPQQVNSDPIIIDGKDFKQLSKEYVIIDLNDSGQNSCQNSDPIPQISASTIKIQDYYMIVDNQVLNKMFQTQQEWEQFYSKVLKIQQTDVKTSTQVKKQKVKLNISELNSILSIKATDAKRRNQYWNTLAINNTQFKFKELCNKKDPQKLDKNILRISPNIQTALFELAQKKYRTIQNLEEEAKKWKSYIKEALTVYGANDKQIGYSKGLQYIAFGILLAKQEIQSIEQFQSHFKYLMLTKSMRNMYFPGTPKLFEEVQLLESMMKVQVPELYKKMVEINADFVKTFINYYKTSLLYKLVNVQVIRKIMELLVIYGVDAIRILLTRIMNRDQGKILMIEDKVDMLKYIAENLVVSYFKSGDDTQVIFKFKQLFILQGGV